MPKQKVKPSSPFRRWLRRIGLAVGAVVLLALLVIATIYVWPVRDARLRQASHTTVNYQTAISGFAQVQATESKLNLQPGCGSILLTHGAPTAQAVVMLHGYTSCPAQFAALAQYFYGQGYNVYVPRAPLHGLQDNKASKDLQAVQLTDYANSAVTLATGLGAEVGVIGHSGGANLATWAAQYRPDVVRRLEAISPFYQPGPQQAPGWEVKPLLVLYGYRILPDQFSGDFSYHTLAQYIQITRNYPKQPPNAHLRSAALVLASDDNEIDKPLARQIMARVAVANHLPLQTYDTDPALHLGHDIVTPDNNPEIGDQAANLYALYFALYTQ